MSKYKESVRKSLNAESKSTRESMADFFSAKKSSREKLSSFKVNGTFNEQSDIKKALTLLKDANQGAQIRASAAMGLVHEAARNEELLDYLIETLSNPEAPVELRGAALSVLQATTFTSPIFGAKRADYMNALRNVATEKTSASSDKALASLKSRAIEYLALEQDEYIQQRLLEGLEDPKKKIVKPEVAIQLLAYDLHADYYPTLRKIVENPPNKRSKKEALRNLAADPDSADLLLKCLNDKNEDKETRHVCAVGLQSLNPEALQRSVKQLITDPKEDKELRVALLNTMSYTPDTKIIDEDPEFQSKLDSIEKKSSSRNFKKVYKKYHQNKF